MLSNTVSEILSFPDSILLSIDSNLDNISFQFGIVVNKILNLYEVAIKEKR